MEIENKIQRKCQRGWIERKTTGTNGSLAMDDLRP